jgi:hypothetical protein
LFCLVAVVPSLVLAIANVVFFNNDKPLDVCNYLYYAIRLASIAFNVVLYCMGAYKLRQMGYQQGGLLGYMLSIKFQQTDPVYTLVSRFKYYPLWQIISRSGAAWYEVSTRLVHGLTV